MGMQDKKTGQEALMEGAWLWAGDIGVATGMPVQWIILPIPLKGRFNIIVRTLRTGEQGGYATHTQVKGEWPNGDRISLEAFMMRLAMQLDHQLAIDDLDQGRPAEKVTKKKTTR